jgi:hypothetical protein
MSVSERWLWSFEDGFRSPFEDVGKVVDRAIILRAMGAATGKQSDIRATVSVKQTEMDALSKLADVLIEVRIAKDASGVLFRAEAKETRTGISLGRVTSADWGDMARTTTVTKVISTDSGYKTVQTSETTYPPVSAIARRLSIELMEKLASRWE